MFGHKRSRKVTREGGTFRSSCVRCGAPLAKDMHLGWHSVAVGRSGGSLRAKVWRGLNRLRCRMDRHLRGEPVRWVNDEYGAGFETSSCRHCGEPLIRRRGGRWRRRRDPEAMLS